MYAVIDTETTGLSRNNDRIIELAVIGLDSKGDREWEWCSLINPGRNTGHGLAVRTHQIYPRDVAEVPTFSDYAGHIAKLLSGRAIVGHNVRFDLGMLSAEFERLGHETPELVQICTATIAYNAGFRPYNLRACCDAMNIDVDGVHHALADARATASLAERLVDFSESTMQNDVTSRLRALGSWPQLDVVTREPRARRIPPVRNTPSVAKTGSSDTQEAARRVASKESAPVVETFSVDRQKPESRYLSTVEWVLEDREISEEQKQALSELRSELNLSDEQVHDVHMMFIRGLAGSMWSDGVISNHEQFDLDIVGELLQLSEKDVEYARDNPIGLGLTSADYILEPGAKVVFTGDMSIPRSEWQERAKTAGLRVTGSVSGKTDYLVVPFGETGSSKSRKARELGVRVVSEQRFWRMLDRLEAKGTN